MNYSDGTATDPSIVVNYSGKYNVGDWVFTKAGVNGYETCGGDAEGYQKHKLVYNANTNTISGLDVSLHNFWGSTVNHTRLSGERYDIKYKTLVTDDKWKEVTSSPDGSLDLINTVLISDDKSHHWSKTKSINIEATEFITKRDLSAERIDYDDISYQIDINPNKYTMNNGRPLTLTDRINTNVDLRAGTVKIKDESGADVTKTSGIEISYNDDTRMLVLNNIPDATKYTLEYIVLVLSNNDRLLLN